MRILLKSVLLLGCIMLFGAFMLAVDQFATPERKEAFNGATGQLADAMAETPEESTGRNRGKGLWKSIQALANGVFRSSPVELAQIMPPAPEGWERRDYAPADGLRLIGAATDGTARVEGWERRILSGFREASEGRALGSAVVYQSGERIVAIRMQGELDNFRKADAGTAAEKAKMLAMPRPPDGAMLYMTVDGLPIGVLPQFTQVKDRRYPTEYRRFVFAMGRLVEGEVIARASDADLVAILGRIDFAAFQVALDEPTERFVMGKGLEWAGETPPSTEMPPATLAWRALGLIRSQGGPARADFDELKAIAQGQVSDWGDMVGRFRTSYDVTPDLVALLGEEPRRNALRRMADEALFVHGPRLAEDDRRALQAVSGGDVTTQGQLRLLPYWQEEWAPEAAEVFSMLPE